MQGNRQRRRGAALAAGVGAIWLAASPPTWACSSCGCTLGTDWVGAGYANPRGTKLDIRFDDVDQNQLRAGTRQIDPRSLAVPNGQEIQQGTLTRFVTLSVDHSFGSDWGVSARMPWLDREHTTLQPGDDAFSYSHTRNIGDLTVLGRYLGFAPDHTWGLQFGLKLPTGAFHENFASGPAQGSLLDRGLQAGTGTIDAVAGLFEYKPVSRSWDRFEQLQVKQAIDSKEAFRPSTQVIVNAGVRYVGLEWLVPEVQLNAKWEGREAGAQGDWQNSGSRVLLVTPGVTGRLFAGAYAYAFVGVPVYQYYNGLQLAPHTTLSLGLRYGW